MDNRTVALTFLQHCFSGDFESALELFAPDGTWWVLGDPEKVKVSGLRDRAKVERFLKNIGRGFPTGMEMTVEGVTAEGDRVAVEASSKAIMADGKPYANRYHFLVQLRDGKVLRMKEYLDTFYTWEVQQASAPPPKG